MSIGFNPVDSVHRTLIISFPVFRSSDGIYPTLICNEIHRDTYRLEMSAPGQAIKDGGSENEKIKSPTRSGIENVNPYSN